MALPPWLNVTPQMFLQAAQAGGAQGLQVAQMRQQAAQQEAARQAAQQEMAQRLQMSREAQLMEQAARQQAAQREGRALDIRERLGFGDQAIRREDLERSSMDRLESSKLRSGELERGKAADEFLRERQGNELEMDRLVQADASKALAEIQSGAPPMEVLMKFPNATADQRVIRLMQMLNQNAGPVTPGGVSPFRSQPTAPITPSSGAYKIREVR